MQMPLGRKATKKDYKQANKELAAALGFLPGQPHPFWLEDSDEGRSYIFKLMIEFGIWPSRHVGFDAEYVDVKFGRTSSDMRVVPISEHESVERATAFAVVLAITTFLIQGIPHDKPNYPPH